MPKRSRAVLLFSINTNIEIEIFFSKLHTYSRRMHPRMKKAFLFLLLYPFLQSASAKDYFQQEVAYTIRVQLDDKKHSLKGQEIIRYTNHSPDSLADIYFHLWPNAYKNDETVLASQM